jgi:hypothetical protein
MSDLMTRSQRPDFHATLEAHGVRWRFNFLAGVPSEDGDLPDYRAEPKWSEKDLTPEQRAELEGWIADHRAARPQDDPQMARWGTMEHNGVECSHLHGRKPVIEKVPSAGFECLTCRAMIVPKARPETFRFVGGPLDGYHLATNGTHSWRVPDPQPVSIAAYANDDEPALSMPFIEYERRGNVYVLR